MDAMGVASNAGRRYSRNSVSYVARVLGARSTAEFRNASAYSPNVMRPRAGSMWEPRVIAASTVDRNLFASDLSRNVRIRSRPAGSRQRASHLPDGALTKWEENRVAWMASLENIIEEFPTASSVNSLEWMVRD